MTKKAHSTQQLVNTFPEWSNIRQDEQSIGYQLFNTAGKIFDDVRKQLERVAANYTLPTSIISDIDIYYKTQLSTSYQFVKVDNDTTDFRYTPPTVSGLVGTTYYNVEIAEKNDIETFWYTPAPDRLSIGTTASLPHFIASGYVANSPLTSPTAASGLHIPNRITVKVEGGASFLGVESKGLIRKGLVNISGKNREGIDISESLIFLHNETQQTLNEFSEVYPSGIRAYGLEDVYLTTIECSSAAFNQDDYSVGYVLDVTQNKEDMPLFWALGSGLQSGVKTLDLKKYDIDDLDLRVQGFTNRHTFLQQELLNTTSSGIVPLDLAVEPHTDRLWVVDASNLYVYDNALPYHNCKLLEGKNYDANAVIEASSHYVLVNEDVEISYLWKRAVGGLVSHRSWVIHPNGTTYSLENGAEVTYHTDKTSWIIGEPTNKNIRQSEIYTLTERGDYVFCLETRYTDGSKSLDKRIVSVVYKVPLKQYSLTALGITTASGVDFDSEEKLWVLAASGIKYQLNRHHDKMMIDFEKKTLYFREPYTQIRVF